MAATISAAMAKIKAAGEKANEKKKKKIMRKESMCGNKYMSASAKIMKIIMKSVSINNGKSGEMSWHGENGNNNEMANNGVIEM